jgi:hypothetical protein
MKSQFKEKIKDRSRKWNLVSILIVFVVSLGVYANSLFNDFVYDDVPQVLENRWIRDTEYIPDILSKDVWAFEREEGGWNYYRPLMYLVYMANYHVFGLRAWGFHLVNLLFHAGVSILVFLIIYALLTTWRLGKSSSPLGPSLAAALFFAAHPIHTEVVAWVAGIPELTFTLFLLISFFFYMRSGDGKLIKGNYLLSLAFFPLALLSKETAVILPLLLILYDFALGMILFSAEQSSHASSSIFPILCFASCMSW